MHVWAESQEPRVNTYSEELEVCAGSDIIYRYRRSIHLEALCMYWPNRAGLEWISTCGGRASGWLFRAHLDHLHVQICLTWC